MLQLILCILLINIPTAFADENSFTLSPAEQKWLAKNHTVNVRVANWPPFQFNKNNNFKGISVDIIKYIFKQHNINYKFVHSKSIPWKYALDKLKDKQEIDLVLTAQKTPEREKNILFTNDYIDAPWVIFTRNDYSFISNIADLNHKTVAVQENFIMQDLLKKHYPEINLQIINGTDATKKALQTLSFGNVDAYIGNLATASYLIKSSNLLNLKIAAPTPFGNHKNAMAVRNDWPELVSIINKTLKNISNKKKNDIYNKYISMRYEHEYNYRKIIIWIILGIIIVGCILLVFVKIIYKLNSEISRRKEIEKVMSEYISLIDDNIISVTLTTSGIITGVSNAFCNLSKYSKEELINKYYKNFWSKDISELTYYNLITTINQNNCWRGEIKHFAKDGSVFWIKAHIYPKFSTDSKNITSYISIGHNITNKKKVELLSITDRLTSMYNRLKLDETFIYELKMSKRYKTDFSIIIIDIDNFKTINDTYGHNTGDIILKHIATILKENTRDTDTVGRWGGDEFLLICPKTTLTAAIKLAEKIRKTIEETRFPTIKHTTLSLGIANYKNNDTQIDMINRADKELYLAKSKGKNKVYPLP